MHVQSFDRSVASPIPRVGCRGVDAAMILHQESGIVVAMYFEPGGEIDEHSSPRDVLFAVTTGQGFVKIGNEVVALATGQAVLWPRDVTHKAWTTEHPMSAIVVDPIREGEPWWTFGPRPAVPHVGAPTS